MFHFEEHGYFLCWSSDTDLIFLGEASMGIKNNMQEGKKYFMLEKTPLKILTLFIKNAINTFYNLTYDHCDLINMF